MQAGSCNSLLFLLLLVYGASSQPTPFGLQMFIRQSYSIVVLVVVCLQRREERMGRGDADIGRMDRLLLLLSSLITHLHPRLYSSIHRYDIQIAIS